MFPFKKKQVDEIDVEVKDLKPKNRRKRKEPPQPWRLQERLIVLSILLFTATASLVFAFRAKDQKLATVISPLTTTKTVIQKVVPQTPPDVTVLKQDLENQLAGYQGTYGIYLEDLAGNFILDINANDSFEGASLFKLPLMIAYYQAIDEGAITGDKTYAIKNSDKATGAGSFASLPAGTVVSYRDIVEAMGKNSDNTAFQIMGNILGWGKIKSVITQINMTNTDFDNSTTTPQDTGLLFSKLMKGELISVSSRNEFLDFLTNTGYEDYLPKGVPDNIKVSHKFGTAGSSVNDAGVIFAGTPYILVVMTNGIIIDDVKATIPAISQTIFDWATK